MSWVVRAVRAELHARRDVALAAAGLGLGEALLAWAAPALDPTIAPLPLLERAGVGPRTLAAALLLLLAARAAAGLFAAGEHRSDHRPDHHPDHHPDPLAALPIRPAAARAVRLLACVLALLCAPLARHAAGLVHGLLVGPASSATSWALGAALDLAQLAALLAAAAAARVLGPLAWPSLGAGALALGLAARLGHLAPLLDPLRLGATRPDPGPGLLAVAGWLAAAALVLVVVATAGGGLARGRARRMIDAAFAPEGFGRVNARLVAILGPLLVVAPALSAAAPRPVASPQPATLGDAGLISARTRRYRFVYPAALAAPARALVRRADGVHDATLGLLGLPAVDPDAPPIELTLEPPGELGPSADPCRSVTLDATAMSALAHATCHALLARAPAARALDGESTWVLEEGLATHAAWRATGGEPFGARFVAAVMHARRPFGEDEHLLASALGRTRGREAAAALGEALVEAARRLGGDGALPALVAALGRGDLPPGRGVEGSRARWSALLRAAELDPAAVREELLVVVEDSAPRDPRAQLDLPRLLVVEELQESQDLKLIAVPDAPLPPDWDVVCRVILDPSDPDARPVSAVRLGADGTGCFGFSRRDELLRLGPRPRVQVGVRPLRPDGPFQGTIWEEWVQLPFVP